MLVDGLGQHDQGIDELAVLDAERPSGSLEPSHVMRAMGIPFTAAHGTVRFSLLPLQYDG
ncbi:hypothetical protein [uncultured Thiodictyon sp.]|uniref:hypothetical protein n=1 Tax=uncultured Thiodictyon sp. TaxID=1846217 RepID=UPI0025D94E3E|nr:hypothetical protein [uncultured Thiodictyon sp.]